MTSSKTGTLPPTSDVLAPWGTTASRRSEQYLSTADTSAVVLGNTTHGEEPVGEGGGVGVSGTRGDVQGGGGC